MRSETIASPVVAQVLHIGASDQVSVERVVSPLLSQVSYIVSNESSGLAAVIDPRRDIDIYLQWAEQRQIRIEAALETHIHADFVSGAPALAVATGATLYRPGIADGNRSPCRAEVADGLEIPIGPLVLKALWTPGHTPEHMAYLLFDRHTSPEPIALFSGDALFVGEVGRPDLLGSRQTAGLIEHLYETVTERLTPLPDDLLVYPGHGAGSSCGKNISDAAWTTIADQRASNYAFNCKDLADFAVQVASNLPAPPTYYARLKEANQSAQIPSAPIAPAGPCRAEDVFRLAAAGAVIIDMRREEAYASGHLPGSIAIGADGNYVQWLGWLDPHDRDLIVILDCAEEFDQVRIEFARIGLDTLVGYLDGGIEAWIANGYPVETLSEIDAVELDPLLAAGEPSSRHVLDVRTPDERLTGAVEGSIHIPASEIVRGASLPPRPDAPIAVICAGGYRLRLIASLLLQQDVASVVNVRDGMNGLHRTPDVDMPAGARA